MSSRKNKKFRGVLKFHGKAVETILLEASAIVKGMGASSWFPTPTVALADVTKAIGAVTTAMSAARFKTLGLVETRDDLLADLEMLLRVNLTYVDKVANDNPKHALEIYADACITPAKVAIANHGYRVHATKEQGGLFIMTKRVLFASYDFQVSTTPKDDTSWKSLMKHGYCKYIATGLQSSTLYYVRVIITDRTGVSATSSVLSAVVN